MLCQHGNLAEYYFACKTPFSEIWTIDCICDNENCKLTNCQIVGPFPNPKEAWEEVKKLNKEIE